MPKMTQAGYIPPKDEGKKPAPAPKPGRPKKKKKKKRGSRAAANGSLAVFFIAVLIGAATIYVYTQTQPYLHTYVPGTMLSGYPLGGAVQEDAQNLLKELTGEKVSSWQYEIICQGQTYTLTAADIGLSVNEEETLDALWQAGRSGGMLTRYIDMLRLRQEPLIVHPVIEYDLSAAEVLLEAIRADVECAPQDASVSFEPGSSTPFAFTQETIGMELDTSAVPAQIAQAAAQLEPDTITLEPREIEPGVYCAVLENAVSLRTRLQVALTGSEAAVANAVLAAQALNGLQIEAGNALSFNESVGKRTQERGYVTAEEPAYGEGVSGVGGGVCQVSGALYRAALLGGYEIRERSAAARPVPYCEMGQEAAVSDQGLDLVIGNDSDYALFVMTRVFEEEKETILEITLFGEPVNVRYALEDRKSVV